MSSSLSEHFIFALTFNKQVSFLTEDDFQNSCKFNHNIKHTETISPDKSKSYFKMEINVLHFKKY